MKMPGQRPSGFHISDILDLDGTTTPPKVGQVNNVTTSSNNPLPADDLNRISALNANGYNVDAPPSLMFANSMGYPAHMFQTSRYWASQDNHSDQYGEWILCFAYIKLASLSISGRTKKS